MYTQTDTHTHTCVHAHFGRLVGKAAMITIYNEFFTVNCLGLWAGLRVDLAVVSFLLVFVVSFGWFVVFSKVYSVVFVFCPGEDTLNRHGRDIRSYSLVFSLSSLSSLSLSFIPSSLKLTSLLYFTVLVLQFLPTLRPFSCPSVSLCP